MKYHTIQAYSNIIKNHIKPRLGFYRLSQITTATLQEFLNNLYVEKAFSKNFMKNILKVLKTSFAYATDVVGFVKENPAIKVKIPRYDVPEEDPAHIFSKEEIQMILERKISIKFILEIPFSFIFGFLVDLYQYIIPTINLNLYTQILVLLIGNTCCAIGVYLMIKGDLIMTPVDGMVLSISEVFHKPYSLCKNIFDISMILATIIICLVCHSSIYGIGIGTVFSAFYIGRVISVLENFQFKTYKK